MILATLSKNDPEKKRIWGADGEYVNKSGVKWSEVVHDFKAN